MADDAIFLSSARGEVRIATDKIVDPTFGPVHLLRVVSGAGPGGGLTDAELRATPVPVDVTDEAGRILGHVIVDSMPAGGAGLTDLELRASPVPVSHGGLTDTQLRAAAVAVSGNWLTDAQLRATAINVATGLTQPLTDAQLRAAAVAVSGPLTDAELRAAGVPVTGTFWQATQPVSGPLTDTQLRAAAVPVSGPVTDAQLRATPVPVSGPVTDAQLRATPVKVAETLIGKVTRHLFMAVPVLSTAAEVMQLLTGYFNGAAVAATATPAVVTAGKTFRITNISLSYHNVATVGSVRFTLRANLAGVAVIGSPLVVSWQIGISGDGASTAGHVTSREIPMSDESPLEFVAGTGIAVGMQGFGAVPTTGTIVGYGKIELLGYEYTP